MSSSLTMRAPRKSSGWFVPTCWSKATTIAARSSMGKSLSNHTAEELRSRRCFKARARRRPSRRCADVHPAPDHTDEASQLRHVQQISEAEIDRAECGDHKRSLRTRSHMRRHRLDRERDHSCEDRHPPKLREKFPIESGPSHALIELPSEQGELDPCRDSGGGGETRDAPSLLDADNVRQRNREQVSPY